MREAVFDESSGVAPADRPKSAGCAARPAEPPASSGAVLRGFSAAWRILVLSPGAHGAPSSTARTGSAFGSRALGLRSGEPLAGVLVVGGLLFELLQEFLKRPIPSLLDVH